MNLFCAQWRNVTCCPCWRPSRKSHPPRVALASYSTNVELDKLDDFKGYAGKISLKVCFKSKTHSFAMTFLRFL